MDERKPRPTQPLATAVGQAPGPKPLLFCAVCSREITLASGHYRIAESRVHTACIRELWRPPFEAE